MGIKIKCLHEITLSIPTNDHRYINYCKRCKLFKFDMSSVRITMPQSTLDILKPILLKFEHDG